MEFTLGSGATLVVSPANFADAIALNKALLESVKGLRMDTDLTKADLGEFLNIILAAATSEEVEKCIFKCGERAVYNDARVTRALFDDPDTGEAAREDYYVICEKIIEVNCKPFFKRIFSELKNGHLITPASRAVPSTQTMKQS